jgi:PAS domain S-box-containing protein
MPPRPKKPKVAPHPAALQQMQSLLATALESTADGLLVVDRGGRFVAYNRKFVQMWSIPDSIMEGGRDEEALEYVLSQLQDPDGFLTRVRELFGRPDAAGVDVLEFKDGRIYERYSQPHRLAGGEVVGRVFSFRDVTARRRAEQVQHAAYRISQATLEATNLQELLEQLHEIVGELMPAKNFYVALVDPAERRLTFPYFIDEHDSDSSSKPLGKGLTEYVIRTGEPLLATPEVHDDLAREEKIELIGPPSIDWLGIPLRVRDETIGALVVQSYEPGVRYREADKDLLTFVCSHIALAIERQRADELRRAQEQAVRESRELLRAVVEGSLDAVFVKDTVGRYLFMNTIAAATLRKRPEDVIGLTDMELFPPEIARAFAVVDRRIIETGETVVFEDTDAAWGGTRSFLVTKGPLRLSDNRIVGVFGVGHDVTERRAAEQVIRQSEERYRSFLEQSTEGVSRLEFDPPVPTDIELEEQIELLYARGVVAECNDAMARMYGLTRAGELVGARLSELHDPREPENRDMLRALIRSGYRLRDAETRQPGPLGSARAFLSNAIGFVEDGNLVRVWSIQRDVTEQRRLEEQFRQAQKMEAVGQLAGGIAHDFNNILTAILGTCQILERDLTVLPGALQDVVEIRRAALRAADLTRQLLAYGRRQVLAPKVLDVNAVVGNLEPMLRRLLGADIQFVSELQPGVGALRADPGQLEQVIVNLIVNARDAMPDGGRLTVATGEVDLDHASAAEHAGAVSGRYVTLEVRDTGTGISPDVRAHLFEPFFTTKAVGQGTGLGLATVYGIVKQSGGFISVSSEVGRGSVFRVHLPRLSGTVVEEIAGGALEQGNGYKGTETVLLAEDEEPVRRLSQRALELEGYTVMVAPDARDALLQLDRHAGPIHLLVTDVVMPGMSGRELASEMLRRRPDIRVLFISGYPGESILQRGFVKPGDAFLQKPFTPVELVRRVREVLDRAATGGKRRQ